MPPQKILKIWVLLHALWCNLERKVSGFHIQLNKIISYVYSDAWFLTLRYKVTKYL